MERDLIPDTIIRYACAGKGFGVSANVMASRMLAGVRLGSDLGSDPFPPSAFLPRLPTFLPRLPAFPHFLP